MSDRFRCAECGEFHKGECDKVNKIVFAIDCFLDELDESLGMPPEPGSRRWMIERGEYQPDKFPSFREVLYKGIGNALIKSKYPND